MTFIATGETVSRAVGASKLLEEKGISCGVISMHTLKPLDEGAILEAARNSNAIITVEEHSIHGGLGEACTSLLMEKRIYKPFKIIGFPDEETVTGSQTEIFTHYNISAQGLTNTALKLLDKI